MNIKETLNITSSKETVQKIVVYIGKDKTKFAELMHLFFNGNERISKKAAWVMGHSINKYPFLANDYIEEMLLMLSPELPDWICRNIVRSLQVVDIPDDFLGLAFDKAYQFVASPNTPTAVKIFSMTMLHNICIKEPELKTEVADVIQLQLVNATKGASNRGKKIIKALEKL